ncbi:MAG: OsmC family protein [candidate division WOR-3 bacterium]
MAIIRKSSAVWSGGLRDGKGKMVVGRGWFEGPFTFASRFESGEGTNPEELIAAAHAGCFSMALSATLEKNGYKVNEVSTEAEVYLEMKEEGPRITKIVLNTKARVEGIDWETFLKFAEQAKKGCPVSVALGGVPEIVLNAELL